MKHFLKEIVQTGLRGANGKIIVWEKLAQNFGVLALADGDPNVAILNDFAERKVGGVAAITPEQYEDYKKKLPYAPPPPKPSEIKIFDMNLQPSKRSPEPAMPPPQPMTPPPDPKAEFVRAATERALAASAAAKGNASSAEAGDTSKPATDADYFKPTVRRPRIKPASQEGGE